MKCSRGFTMLELLMALALSAMLMIGVMAVIAQLGAKSVRQASANAGQVGAGVLPGAGMESMARLMGEDIGQAERVDATRPNQLELTGYCGLDDQGRGRSHRPVDVVYRLEQVNGRTWLVRRQMLRDVLTNENIQRDLVCGDVTGFAISPAKKWGAAKPQSSGESSKPGAANKSGATHRPGASGRPVAQPPADDVLRLSVRMKDGGPGLSDRIIAVRSGGGS
ncbi:MAG: prepilin-type N-terminal cleavage/methylation domain-containing protein [Phycisphaeraceae bacterium]